MQQLIRILIINITLMISLSIKAQKVELTNTDLWRISGNNLKENSYILLTNFSCAEKIEFSKNVKEALKSVKTIAVESDVSNKDSAKKVETFMMPIADSQRLKNVFSNIQYQEYVKTLKDEGGTDQVMDQINGIKAENLYSMSLFPLLPCEESARPQRIEDALKIYSQKIKIDYTGLQSVEQYFLETQLHPKAYWRENIWFIFKNEIEVKEAMKIKMELFNNLNFEGLQNLFVNQKYYQLRTSDNVSTVHINYLTKKIEEQSAKSSTLFQIDVSNILLDNISVLNILKAKGFTINAIK